MQQAKIGSFVFFGFLISVSDVTHAATPGLLDYPQGGVNLKTGWDTNAGRKTTSVCIDAATDRATGDQSYFTYREVNEQSSLSTAFNSSVSAKVQMAIGGGGGSVSYSRDTSLSTTGLNIAVQYLILHGPAFLAPPGASPSMGPSSGGSLLASPVLAGSTSIRLLPRYARMARRQPLQFRRECGDSFVAVITFASGIEGVLVASTRTQSEKTSVSGSFNASYLTASGAGSLSSTVTKMASENRLSLTYHKMGAPGTPGATSIEGFHNLIQTVGTVATPATAPPTHIILTSYEELPNYPRSDEPTDTINAIASQYLRLLTIYRHVTDATTNPSNYIHEARVTRDSVITLEGEMLDHLRLLGVALRECGRVPRRGSRLRPRCNFPNVPKTDWTYRARLPLSKEAAWAYDRKTELEGQIPGWTTQRDRFPVNDRWCGGFANTHCGYSPNPQYAHYQAKINEANAFISENAAALNHEDQRFQVFIADPRKIRCDQQELDVCISASEAAQIRSQM